MATFEVLVDDADHGLIGNLFLGDRLPHQVMIALKRLLLIGTEIVLHPANLGHPDSARFAEPGLSKMTHDELSS
jgi:hypothetical protein